MSHPGRTLLWRRLDRPGHEAARLVFHEPFWQLSGMAVFAYEDQACRLEYAVVCDGSWQTRHAWVVGWVGLRHVRVDLLVTVDRRWHLDGRAQPELGGCLDIDLAFSPSTNMLPIRRLGLEQGQAGAARAAWLAFPAFQLEALDQTYRRTGDTTYRYETDGAPSTELVVDPDGFVRRYPGRWELESV